MLDISLVVFRPSLPDLQRTLHSLAAIRNEFGTLWILISGRSALRASVQSMIDDAGLGQSVQVEHRFDNLGFASGHNRLLKRAFSAGAVRVLVLNPDVLLEPGAVSALSAAVEQQPENCLYGPALARIGADSSSVALVDSLGIAWSRSGRHFDIDQGLPLPRLDGTMSDVCGVTGACMLVSAGAFDTIVSGTGYFFDDTFLAYREDAELCIRAGQVGVGSRSVMLSGFGHVRSVRGFQRGKVIPDLLGVRNRFLMKWRLGKHRPGNSVLAGFRDVLVIVAVLLGERSSMPGLKESFAIRRYSMVTSKLRRTNA
ncbi:MULTISPECIES: glycosyltransferase family 2 protein [Stenotrophomonas]|uniref:Glycosyltransferase family 2 protein n=1 Tax=Stenotrophomonas lactitubi TaxID=2045214 RepID=A0AAW4GH91_9GAMM|nr:MULTISPECIES: glycosyltransferase family 2 protein [Stenotrophomonas]MBM9913266.1 glycosyltransferase family 2 protein [Stenotrophomonas lactitubi]MBM9923152.1 glycosyltransferase family 2 protein [Stenotrophomonas lactitubi]MBM9939137.1 glycosyltransferase family 2 protein [Stenotrophomonas lactitubi]